MRNLELGADDDHDSDAVDDESQLLCNVLA